MFARHEPGGDSLALFEVATGAVRDLTRDLGRAIFADASPDGRWVLYRDEDAGDFALVDTHSDRELRVPGSHGAASASIDAAGSSVSLVGADGRVTLVSFAGADER